jgi:carotenoid cleavage dioxygenase-like enzyme
LQEVLSSHQVDDPISIFKMPQGWFAQEPRFISRQNPTSEDDGWLVTYVYDESQLDSNGECPDESTSELWVIDATDMKTIVARVYLTQRVPYGLHGTFFSERQVTSQRPIETIRGIKSKAEASQQSSMWLAVRDRIEALLG